MLPLITLRNPIYLMNRHSKFIAFAAKRTKLWALSHPYSILKGHIFKVSRTFLFFCVQPRHLGCFYQIFCLLILLNHKCKGKFFLRPTAFHIPLHIAQIRNKKFFSVNKQQHKYAIFCGCYSVPKGIEYTCLAPIAQ